MIIVKLPAEMTCDEPGCKTVMQTQIALMTNGTLGFRPVHSSAQKWEVGMSPNPGGPWLSRCPEHRSTGLVLPTGLAPQPSEAPLSVADRNAMAAMARNIDESRKSRIGLIPSTPPEAD